ncbi:MAG TPA: DNA-binding protein [Alphaproteobacteria bacterium]|nr:DNA-binding protein [Alphaproteobacteria bacterium]HAJ47987.1 DNA-binding protein [Alphaproteobacteria bacterium]
MTQTGPATSQISALTFEGTRPYTRSEVAADAVIHVLGVTAGVIGAGVLVTMSALYGTGATLAASIIYGTGLVAMLSFSAAYNMHPPGPRREFLRRLDHAAIFLMIAGTYTPLTTLHLSGAWAITITSLVWAMAVTGITLKIAFPRRFERLSLAAYLAMGWMGVVAIEPLLASLPMSTFVLIGVGGVLYSAGTAFHVWESLPFQNAIWHGFVLAAAVCHYAAVFIATPFR